MCLLIRRLGSWGLVITLLFSGYSQHAFGAVIGTDRAIAAEQHQARVAHLQSLLVRDDVTQRLAQLGVDPVQAQERVAALTEYELARYSEQLNSLPAGAGALEVVGIVFIVLLILELVGVTNIFSNF